MDSLCQQFTYTLSMFNCMKDYIRVRPDLHGTFIMAVQQQLYETNITDDEVSAFGYFALDPEAFIDYAFNKITNHGQELNSTDWVPMMVSLVHGVVIKNVFRLHGLIPNLNVMSPAGIEAIDGRLVHFRGMVQRQHDPKVYRPYIRIRNTATGAVVEKCSVFSDKVELKPGQELVEENDCSGLKQVEFITFVSVPGESEWKLQRDMDVNRAYKNIMFATPPSSGLSVPLVCLEGQLEDRLNPISVLAKMHRRLNHKDEIRMNDIVNLVGLVTVDKSGTNDDGMNGSAPNEANNQAQLSLSVLGYWKAEPEDLDDTLLETAFTDFKIFITQCLRGDELCAHYVLMNILSSVRCRTDGIPVGHFPLCITGIPEEVSRDLHRVVKAFVPSSVYLTNFLESVTNENYVPWMDYEADKLVTGALQIGNGTHLFVEEADISEEKLRNLQKNTQAKKNLAGLESLIGSQTMAYDFIYQRMDIFHDAPVLILSSAKKTMFSNVLQVPFRPAQLPEGYENFTRPTITIELLQLEDVDLIRRAIVKLKARKQIEIREDVEEEIGKDFANMRSNGIKIDSEGLSALVTQARILTFIAGRVNLTVQIWKEVLKFDAEMRQRIQEGANN
ncbi:mini-chromosome maintenance complex-binding protein [Folsomia candida]|uniref:mini-chromosome maintenance complex-binding protein n=1 Tax=Folsomia candida TaxID=158441 RepID=UPI000B90610A|nr:mini-chromosome maintenance complex-binding protein [Folsomia candida]